MNIKLKSILTTIKEFIIQYAIALTLILLLVLFASIDSSLLSLRNLRNILSNSAPLLLVASGMALCLYIGYIDLSAGAVASFAGIIAGSLMQSADTVGRFFSTIPAISIFLIIPLICILFCVVGICNALLIKRMGIPSWFSTLGFACLLSGGAHVYLYDSDTILKVLSGFSKQFLTFGAGYIGDDPTYSIPITLAAAVLIVVVIWICTKCFSPSICPSAHILKSKSISQNSLSYKKLILIYGLAGALFALAGMMLAGRTDFASVELGRGLEIDAIAICLIAGFSLFGGRGNFASIFIATFLYTATIYSADFIGINQFVPRIMCGVLLLAAVSIDIRRMKNDIHTEQRPITGSGDSGDTN